MRGFLPFLLLATALGAAPDGDLPGDAVIELAPAEQTDRDAPREYTQFLIDSEAAATSQESPVDWKRTLTQAGLAMGFQHAFRVAAQPKTRAELGGPFFQNYWQSLKGIRGWRDGDPFFTNYVAHPMMGSMAGYIYITNDRRAPAEFSNTSQYWKSRLRATAFSAAYSTMFEIGPVSEATIGNVGINPGTNGAVDFVVTPVGGLGWMVAEDVLDKHVIRPFERNIQNRWLAAALRCALNPSRSVVEITKFQPPWRRPDRQLPR